MPNPGIFTTGPRHVFAIFGSQGQTQPRYLGTCVVAPDMEGEKFKLPVMNDLGGRSTPFQLVKDGENWLLPVTLNRFDLALCRQLLALDSTTSGANGVAGQESPTARGTLVIGISDFQLVVVNQYAGTPAAGANAGDLTGGRLWYSCNVRKYKESTAGTRVLEVAMALDCQNVWAPSTGGFQLYTDDVTASQYLPLIR